MCVVLADPAGFAVDWDWRCGLTVWALGGRGDESHFARKVLEHQLPARPASEGRARRAARHWWQARGWPRRRAVPDRRVPIRAVAGAGERFGTWDGALAALSLHRPAQGQ